MLRPGGKVRVVHEQATVVKQAGVVRPLVDAGVRELDNLLVLARERLRMDLVVMASDDPDDARWRPVSSAFWPEGHGPSPEDTDGLAETFDRYLLDVRLGRLEPTPTTVSHHVDRAPELADVIRVPLRSGDGAPFGVLCGFGERDRMLGSPEADALRPFADVLVDVILAGQDDWSRPVSARKVLRRLQEAGGPAAHFQPMMDLRTRELRGHESLARFPLESPSPLEWFRAANLAGELIPLELSAIRAALAHLPHLEGHLSINVSELTLRDDGFATLMADVAVDRVVIEITEQRAVEDYVRTLALLEPLRARGALLAIDDVGSGYASLRHVLALNPDIIKLDMGLVHGIDARPQQQALVRSLNDFATRTGVALIAEGIETEAELQTLIDLDVQWGQGFLLGRPAPCAEHARARLPELATGR